MAILPSGVPLYEVGTLVVCWAPNAIVDLGNLYGTIIKVLPEEDWSMPDYPAYEVLTADGEVVTYTCAAVRRVEGDKNKNE